MASNPCATGPEAPRGEMISYPSGDAQVRAYLSRPTTAASTPGVVVVHENRGLVQYLKDVADGLASYGYTALVPDLLSREGGSEQFTDPATQVPPLLGQIPPERHVGDVLAAIDYLRQRPDVAGIGVIGFCFGGGVTWRVATKSRDIAAAAPFYGPNPPLEDVANISAAVLAVYGELDERINAGLPDVRAALQRHGIEHEIRVYRGSQHAFHNHDNAERHNPETAAEAWQAALMWFDRHLKGSGSR